MPAALPLLLLLSPWVGGLAVGRGAVVTRWLPMLLLLSACAPHRVDFDCLAHTGTRSYCGETASGVRVWREGGASCMALENVEDEVAYVARRYGMRRADLGLALSVVVTDSYVECGDLHPYSRGCSSEDLVALSLPDRTLLRHELRHVAAFRLRLPDSEHDEIDKQHDWTRLEGPH